MLPYFFVISTLLSAAYFVTPSVFVKPLSIWSLSILSLLSGKDNYSHYIAVGLLLSSAGDVLLELDNHHPDGSYFIPGLVAFLAAHLCYIRAFYSSKLSFKYAPYVLILVVVYYIGIMNVLIPSMEAELVAPVLVYGVAISTMIFLAFLRFLSPKTCNDTSKLCSLIGSLVFVVSDSILALNKFAFVIPHGHYYVMLTYYFGQTFIAASTHKNAKAKVAGADVKKE